MTIELKRSADTTWLARFSDWRSHIHLWGESWDGFLPTPFFGPAKIDDVAATLLAKNPGASIVELTPDLCPI